MSRLDERKGLPSDTAKILSLQSTSGQWRLCESLYHSLGHSSSTIPIAPPGVKDWRWATALAVMHLRRRPELIDDTFDAYGRALPWVDEPLLAEAHKRLPPRDLNYPVESKALREGRWQEFTARALEECGHAYFLPVEGVPTAEPRGEESDGNGDSSANPGNPHDDFHATSYNEEAEYQISASALDLDKPARVASSVSKKGGKPRASWRSGTSAGSTPAAAAAAALCKEAIKRQAIKQSDGLHLELRRAVRAARTTFREGDRVESRWRRPTRLDRPRVDPHAWHPGRVIAVGRNGKLSVIFEDGKRGEDLSGIPRKHVRLAPGSIPGSPPMSDSRFTSRTEAKSSKLKLGAESLRELAHVASTTELLRSAWENPLTMNQELARLRRLLEDRNCCRPAWRGSFPAVNFQTTKREPIGGEATAAIRDRTQRRSGTRRQQQQQRHARHNERRKTIRLSRTSRAVPVSHNLLVVTSSAWRPPPGYEMHTNIGLHLASSSGLESAETPFVLPALAKAQSDLVAAAIAYDGCVSTVSECLERGIFSFRTARTYSEQQSAFEETTANLGPAQRARAGYTDWRGSTIVGLQNATLDVVEALDTWTIERAPPAINTFAEVDERCSDPDTQRVDTCPFLWEGSPLVSKIIGYSAGLFERAPELKEWYGPGFPVARNPFLLAYSIDDRLVTPRNALVRANVDGQVRGSRRAARLFIELLRSGCSQGTAAVKGERCTVISQAVRHFSADWTYIGASLKSIILRTQTFQIWSPAVMGKEFTMIQLSASHEVALLISRDIHVWQLFPRLASHIAKTFPVKTTSSEKITTTVSAILLAERKKEEASLKAILYKQAAAPSWWPAAGEAMTEGHYSRIRRAEKTLLREERNIRARRAVHTSGQPPNTAASATARVGWLSSSVATSIQF